MNTATCTNTRGQQNSCTVNCDTGLTIVGGGVLSSGDYGDEASVNSSYPSSRTSWTAKVDKRSGSSSDTITVYALCASATQVT